MLALKLIHKNS